MEISEIKEKLTLKRVLDHYGLKPDKHLRLHCPFHDDRTPSLQVYYKTHTCYCFSTNCPTHGRAMDVVDFIMYKEHTTKHEAILKAKAMIRGEAPSPKPSTDRSKSDILARMFTYFKNAVHNSKPAKEYLEKRGLDHEKVEVGHNTGQFHHGKRKEEGLIADCLRVGLLKDKGLTSRTGEKAYVPFAKGCVCFALRDAKGKVAGLYFRSITDGKDQRHFYLKDRKGLYPGYPDKHTKKLILTESIIDAASLLQQDHITEHFTILALYGTNGLTEEHKKAIRDLRGLEETIFFLNGDEAGRKATEKHGTTIKELQPNVTLSTVDVPEGEDVNSLLVGHAPEILPHLIGERSFFLSSGTSTETSDARLPERREKKGKPGTFPHPDEKALDTTDPDRITWEGEGLKITIWGGIEYGNLHRLKLSLHLEDKGSGYTFRDDVNLYSNRSRKTFLQEASEELETSLTGLKKTIEDFTEAVEAYRMEKRKAFRERKKPSVPELSEEERKEALRLLKDGDLTKHLRRAMERTGLIGETGNGLLLFLIFLTRFFDNPLHALVHGSSGSGKTNLLKSVLKLVPRESKYETTALTENVLFRPPHKDFWKHRILLLEDLDGSYKALLPLREFMSNQYISKFSSEPDPRTGKFEQVHLEAHGPLVIAGATTKDKVYEDNSNRSFLLHVNEGREHQRRILEHQNKEAAGLIHQGDTEELLRKVHNIQRMLDRRLRVVNPFQPELRLPEHVFKKLRTNTHYITLIKAVTFLHQYQREKKKDAKGSPYIETTLEDVALANELSKHSLLRKSDELSGQVRDFFESLKRLLEEEGKESFLAKEVRARLRMHPMKFSRYVNELKDRGYVKKTAGKEKGSFEYRIEVWDDYRTIKKGLDIMDRVLEGLYERHPDGTYHEEEITVNREEITSSREKQKAPSIKGSDEEITK